MCIQTGSSYWYGHTHEKGKPRCRCLHGYTYRENQCREDDTLEVVWMNGEYCIWPKLTHFLPRISTWNKFRELRRFRTRGMLTCSRCRNQSTEKSTSRKNGDNKRFRGWRNGISGHVPGIRWSVTELPKPGLHFLDTTNNTSIISKEDTTKCTESCYDGKNEQGISKDIKMNLSLVMAMPANLF